MYTTVTFMGRDVTANAEDELPIKNHLPADLGASFRTLNQWLNCGRCPADSASYLNEKQVVESALKQSTGSGGLTAIGMKGLMD